MPRTMRRLQQTFNVDYMKFIVCLTIFFSVGKARYRPPRRSRRTDTRRYSLAQSIAGPFDKGLSETAKN
jgi:hypothetical protein